MRYLKGDFTRWGEDGVDFGGSPSFRFNSDGACCCVELTDPLK